MSIVGQYVGPVKVIIKLIASSTNLKATKYGNAFKSFMRKQKINAYCLGVEIRNGNNYSQYQQWDMNRVPTIVGTNISYSYYKKIYDFKIENIETHRPIHLFRSIS